MNQPLRQTTLCLLVKDNQILLAMKKRGFGQGRWNGVGGKPKPEESIEEALLRETQEEIGVIPKVFKRMATLNFLFPDVPKEKNWDQQVCVFLVENWEGEPQESEEMAPKWFNITEIPFEEMWPDDQHWLPKVLQGIPIIGHFTMNQNQGIDKFELLEGSF